MENQSRSSQINRKTLETNIKLRLDLDKKDEVIADDTVENTENVNDCEAIEEEEFKELSV